MKTLKLLERLWLSIMLISAGIGVYMIITASVEESIWFFIVALFAGIIFLARRKQRINSERVESD